jgi:uncharacterized protein (TIRG00374 family)
MFFAVMTDACDVPVEAPRPRLTWKTAIFPVLGLVAFFLYIYLFQVDLISIIATVQTADPIPYALAASLSIAEVFFYSTSWRVLLNYLNIKLSVVKSYLFVWYGIFLDIIIPAESVSGEAIRVYLIQREQGVKSCGPTVASLVTHRLLGMAMNVGVLLLGVGLLFIEGPISGLILNLILFLTAGITAVLILLIIFSFKERWSLKVINGLISIAQFITRGRWKGLVKIKEDAFRITKSFHDSMKKFGHSPKPLASSLIGLSVTWILSLSMSYLVFLSLKTNVSWSVILITSAIVLAVKSVPLGVPFEVGLPEITMTTIYTSFGIPPEISATATILIRILTLWLRFFVGLVAQQWLDLKPVLKVSPEEVYKVQKPETAL